MINLASQMSAARQLVLWLHQSFVSRDTHARLDSSLPCSSLDKGNYHQKNLGLGWSLTLQRPAFPEGLFGLHRGFQIVLGHSRASSAGVQDRLLRFYFGEEHAVLERQNTKVAIEP